MKDIIITAKRQKTEIGVFCACIILAILLNVCSIISFGTEWTELWTQSFWMVLITFSLYGLSILLRLLFYGLSRMRKNK